MAWQLRYISLFFAANIVNSQYQGVRVCDVRPSGTESRQTKADGRFKLYVPGATEKLYTPGDHYTVVLNGTSFFTSFWIMTDGEYVQEKDNPRKYNYREPGTLKSKTTSAVPIRAHSTCENAVEQVNKSPKKIVEVEWIAPRKGQGCVTIHAMVAENEHTWYMDDGPLMLKICEDTRKVEDTKPVVIEGSCGASDEAKYELTFEGQWSRNTHPRNYPETATRRFSDLVGASHSGDYYLWDYNQNASPGLKLLAESANTTILEQEIQDKFDNGVRTLIKASGQGGVHISEPTRAIFRVDSIHHLISIATSIVPSPDWFLGVPHFELCLKNNSWVMDRELNLYPVDAGTDQGVSYNSSNEEQLPPGIVKPIAENSDNVMSPFYAKNARGQPRHFGRMRVQRVYETSNKVTKSTSDESEPSVNPNFPTEEPDSSSPDEPCPMTDWLEWSDCTPECGPERNRFRSRYHLVNGIEVRYIKDPHLTTHTELQVPKHCFDKDTFMTESCEALLCAQKNV